MTKEIEKAIICHNGIWCLRNDNSITIEVKATGKLAWDPAFKEVLETINGRAGVVIDVGAYIGDSTDHFLGSHYRVIAFEPQLDAYECLRRNVSRYQSSNSLILPEPVGNGETVWLGDGQAGNMGARRSSKIPFKTGTTGIKTTRLDSFANNAWVKEAGVALIKIDVEGFEPNVLAGAQKLIQKHWPCVMVEFNVPALRDQGFTPEDITKYFKGWRWKEVFRLDNEQWDVVWIPTVKAIQLAEGTK